MKLVAQKTSIRLPKVYRSFNVYGTGGIYDSTGYIVMDYIEGASLAKSWKDLSSTECEKAIEQVTDMISQLQSLHIPTPGPLADAPSRGGWFSDYGSGPFRGVSDFQDYFNTRLAIAKRTGNAPIDTPNFNFSTFVMTHLDISPRNLIRDPQGQLWLIDWGYAGGYPTIMEAATLACQLEYPDFNRLVLERIPYDDQELQQFMRVRAAKRFMDPSDVSYYSDIHRYFFAISPLADGLRSLSGYKHG